MLLSLVALAKKLGAFSVWVDAVCINQTNTKEKEHQIPLMREMYTSAKYVYIWLGPGNVATERAMAYLSHGGVMRYFTGDNTVEESFERLRMLGVLLSYLLSRWSSTTTLVPESLNTWSWLVSPLRNWRIARGRVIVSLAGIETALNCDWTNRIWTYQEAILATRPILVRGDFHLPWPEFTSAMIFLDGFADFSSFGKWLEIISSRAHYQNHSATCETRHDDEIEALKEYSSFVEKLQDKGYAVPTLMLLITLIVSPPVFLLDMILAFDYSESLAPRVPLSILSIIILLFWIQFWLPPNPPLPHKADAGFGDLLEGPIHLGLINTLCWRQASNPRDLSIGILPFIQHISPDTLPIVDSSAEVSIVYTELAALFLERGKIIDILSMAAEARCPGASSWVPDFSLLSHISRRT